eukprot:COSAG06_NODE_71414_length_184_cov_31.682353_1_plen_33_part_10
MRFLRKLRERTRQLLLRELWKVRKQQQAFGPTI